VKRWSLRNQPPTSKQNRANQRGQGEEGLSGGGEGEKLNVRGGGGDKNGYRKPEGEKKLNLEPNEIGMLEKGNVFDLPVTGVGDA